MKSKEICGDYFSTSKILKIVVPAFFLLTAVAASAQVNGEMAYGPFEWNALNFPALWQEDGLLGEVLSVNQPDLGSDQRVIDKEQIFYNTAKRVVPYKVFNETGLTVWNGLDASGYKVSSGGYYAKVGWLGKPYVAVNGKANKLSEIVLEQNLTDIKDLNIMETWNLGNGYDLTLMSINTTSPEQALFILSNEYGTISEFIGEEGDVTTVVRNIGDESDAPFFVTYIDNISENSVGLKYTWLISESVMNFNAADKFGIMEIRIASSDGLNLSNENSITLERGSTVNLLGNIYFVVNDNESLEYYPMMNGELPPQPTPVHNINTGENFSSIQAAIDDSDTMDGHTITVDEGTYIENIYVNKQLTIRSTSGNPENTIIQAPNPWNSIFTIYTYNVEISGFTVEGATSSHGIYLSWVSNCNISNNKVKNNGLGIYAYGGSYNNYIGNNISNNYISNNNWAGLYLLSTYSDIVKDNIITNNNYGIYTYSGSYNNYTGNDVSNNGGVGFSQYYSNYNIVKNNKVKNNYQGIYSYYSSYNNLIGNIVNNNSYTGITFDWDNSNNEISSNILTDNNNGISIYNSYGNRIYNNYFKNCSPINNTCNNVYEYSSNNIWNTNKTAGTNIFGGPYLGGNYWSDYNGMDFNEDGLGDTFIPYTSSGRIQYGGDYLPLTVPRPPPTIGLKIDPTGSVERLSGEAKVSGSLNCSIPMSIRINGEMKQRAGRFNVFSGSFNTQVMCDGATLWGATVRGGPFNSGQASVNATAVEVTYGTNLTDEESAVVQLKPHKS